MSDAIKAELRERIERDFEVLRSFLTERLPEDENGEKVWALSYLEDAEECARAAVNGGTYA